MSPKQHRRPQSHPNYHSDSVLRRSTSPVPHRSTTPLPPLSTSPPSPTSIARPAKASPDPFYAPASPEQLSPTSVAPPRLPSSRPTPTNPNPFAAANANVLIAQADASRRSPSPAKTRPVSVGAGSGRTGERPPPLRMSTQSPRESPSRHGLTGFDPTSIDPLSPRSTTIEINDPTSMGPSSPRSPYIENNEPTSMDPLSPRSTAIEIKVENVTSPSNAHEDDDDDFATLNFARRPSQFDPIAPSFHGYQGSNSGNSTARQLVGHGPVPPVPQRSTSASRIHQRKTSHTRQPSISLSSPSSSPLPSPSFLPTQSKILPLQPAAPPARGTRAPIEAFASIEMLQGQRQHAERTRGTEVWGPGGYEGRASSLSGDSGLPAYARRENPLSALHAARNPGYSTGGPQLPPVALAENEVASIASQLREHDKLRRGSEDARGEWARRFSETSSGSDDAPPAGLAFTHPGDLGGAQLNPHYSFPARDDSGSLKSTVPSSYSDSKDHSLSALDGNGLSGSGKKGAAGFFRNLASSAKHHLQQQGGGWATENLGPSSHPFSLAPRPSIVALPVYPSPSGTVGRSFLPRAKKVASRVAILTALLSIAATGVYLGFRYSQMRSVERKMPGVFVGGWAFLVLETVVAAVMAVHTLYQVITYRARGAAPKMRLRGDQNLPAVDVFIVSSGQVDQTVFDCAVAAASMDYPPHRYRVMVLDPLASSSLAESLAKHSKSQACPHLSYHKREVGLAATEEKKLPSTPGGTRMAKKVEFENKANSINFGMMEASSFGIKGPAEYIAVFDADMIPERNYLRAVLPSVLADNKVALVKTRHGFINLPRKLNQPTSTMMTAAETDADNRSGFLLRRTALTEIGGFPTDSWIHDGQCEALLLGRGYQVAQVDEVLQWGMAKPTYHAQVNAMMVNRLGPLRTAGRLGWFVRGDKTKLMPFAARLKFIGKALLPIFSVIVVLLAYVYPFMFSFGGILVLTPNLRSLDTLLLSTLIMTILQRTHEALWAWSTGLPTPRRALQSWIFAAPYNAWAIVRLILPRKVGGYARGSDLHINETIAVPEREPWWNRVFWFCWDPHAGTMVAFLAAVGVAIWRIVKDYERGTVDSHQTALTVLLTIAWPTLLWLEFVFAAFVPFLCLLFPSRLLTEPRESFLIRDHYSSVARPKHHFKTAAPFKVHRAPEFLTGSLFVAWTIACFCVAKLTDVLA
ncbi:hypothetical protein JCM1840_006696 [Sporobolomyces johnsonii]